MSARSGISRPRTRRRWTTSVAAACTRGTPAAAWRSAATATRWRSARRTRPPASKGVNGNQRDNSVFEAGAVYVYTRTGSGWTQQAYIKASNPQMSAGFGHFVALSDDGNTLAVSAYWESSNAKGINGNQQDESIPQAGAVYVFTRQGATWSQQAYVKASNTGEAGTADAFGEGDQFGFSLALSGDGSDARGGRAHRGRRGAGHQRQPGRQLRGVGGRGLRLHAHRPGVVAAGLRQVVEHRRRRPVRLRGGAEPRRQRAGGRRLRRGRLDAAGERPAPTTAPTAPAPPTCSPGPARRGRSRRTSSRRTARRRTRSAWTWRSATTAARCSSARSTRTAPRPASTPPGCDNDWRDDLSMGAAYVFVRSGATLVAAGVPQGVEHRPQRLVRRRGSPSAATATWPSSAPRSRTAAPRASTAGATTRPTRPAPSTCSRGPAPPGASRPTSRARTPRRSTSSAARSPSIAPGACSS